MTDPSTDRDGDTETFGNVTVTHRFKTVDGPDGPVLWHYVEAGPQDAEAIVLVHGNGESWYSWHHQIEAFGSRYRIVAFDMKGYGQSDKSDGNYHWEHVSEEALALLDALDLRTFNVAAHDRGAVLMDYLAGNHPERIRRYLRMAQLVHIWEPDGSPQAQWFADPVKGPEIFRDFFEQRMAKMLKKPLSDAHRDRIVREQSFPGIPEAVPRYFRASSFEEQLADRVERLLRKMNFPVLLLYGTEDKGQPMHYYNDPDSPAADQFPNARLEWIEGGGHFTTVDNPEEITRNLGDLLSEPLG